MFITIEGIDGCGKSTHARRLCDTLAEAGHSVLWTREPGHWFSGTELRQILLQGKLEHLMTELLLFVADRCEHVKQVVLPALASGSVVVCERYSDSTLAYQCWGRGLPRHQVEQLLAWCDFPVPDVTLWLKVSVEEALARRQGRSESDRIEGERMSFHQRLHEGFAALAKEDQRFVSIDASRDQDDVAQSIVAELRQRGLRL